MNPTPPLTKTRRKFLKLLGASPVIAGSSMLAGGLANLLHAALPEDKHFLGWLENLQQQGDAVISSPDQALDVMDFEPVARKAIPPAHWGYMATGVDGEETLRANREAYSRYQLRSRRFVDVSKMDMSVELFGTKFNSPILLCPVGGQKAFYLQGEV